MRNIILIVLLLSLPLICVAGPEGVEYYKNGKHYFKPKDGFVPNEATAIKIAEAVWLPIYGESIYEERPFGARLEDGIWIVTGSLPEGWLGGVAECEISKDTSEILRISHGE